MIYIFCGVGILIGIIILCVYFSMGTVNGVIEIDQTDPENDKINMRIYYDVNSLYKKRRAVFKIVKVRNNINDYDRKEE